MKTDIFFHEHTLVKTERTNSCKNGCKAHILWKVCREYNYFEINCCTELKWFHWASFTKQVFKYSKYLEITRSIENTLQLFYTFYEETHSAPLSWMWPSVSERMSNWMRLQSQLLHPHEKPFLIKTRCKRWQFSDSFHLEKTVTYSHN